MLIVFPALVIGPTLLNQERSDWALRIFGQIVMMGGTLAVIVILFSTLGRQKWLLLCVAGLLISKAGRITFGENSVFFPLYICFMAILFSRAGCMILIQEPRLIYKQVIMFCKLSAPLMILQILGVGKWTQFLRNDYHSYFDEAKVQVATLFADKADVIVTTFQARPAGLCHANNVLTPIIIFALGLHYGLVKTSRLTFNDVALCIIAVLTMSKLLFLSFGVIVLWLLVVGDNSRRRKMMKVILLFCILMAAYRFFFPGLYSYNLDKELMKKNFYGRVSVLAESFGDGMAKEIIVDAFEESFHLGGTGSVSGYSVIARGLKYVVVLALLPMFFYWWGLRRLRKERPELVTVTILFIFIFFLMPLGNWFIGGPVFWFIAGFGLLPLFLVLDRDFFRWGLKRKLRRSF